MDRKVFVHLRAVIVKDVLCSVQRHIFNAESAEVVDFQAFPVYSVTYKVKWFFTRCIKHILFLRIYKPDWNALSGWQPPTVCVK